MHTLKKGLIRIGAYLLMGGMLAIPVSCDRDKDRSVEPTLTTNRNGRLDQAGCGGFTNGKFLGTWTVTGSRLQALVTPDNKQYIAQIFNDNEFYIRGKEFLRRGDIAGKTYSEAQIECFEGDAGDPYGWGVSTFQPPAGFEPAPTQYAYRVSCSPRFNLGPNSPTVPIAFWNSAGSPLEARYVPNTVGTQVWIVQNVSAQTGYYRDAFVFRGRNILLRSDVSNFQDPWDIGRRYCFASTNGDTGTDGLNLPANAPNSPNAIPGYDLMHFSDGTPYYLKQP